MIRASPGASGTLGIVRRFGARFGARFVDRGDAGEVGGWEETLTARS